MFKQMIKKISNDFITEASLSPKLLEDMAAMEKYMAESYSNRTFIELLQNADDAVSSKIYIFEDDNNIYFANNGKPFDENDILSICRSGSSSKKRGENIGYRGVGFKSTTQISNEILIFSNDEYFSFSKKMCSDILGKDIDKIPTIRIPLLVENVDTKISDQVTKMIDLNFTTVFVFKNANINRFYEEIQEVSSGYFIFLNNISNCIIKFNNIEKNITIDRDKKNRNQKIKIIDSNNINEWFLVKSDNASVAFKLNDGKIVPCLDDEAVYHSYLPTIDKVIYPIKVNADFSTDPSRKHITFDENTNNALDCISKLIFEVICSIFSSKVDCIYKDALSLFLMVSSFSRINNELDKRLTNLILTNKWIRLNNNDFISAKDYKKFPKNYDQSDIINIRKNSTFVQNNSVPLVIYDNINFIDSFINKYSKTFFTNVEIIKILENENFVNNINITTHSKTVSNVIKEVKQQNMFSNNKISIGNIIVPTENSGLQSINNIKSKGLKIDGTISKGINENLLSTEVDWFLKETGISDKVFKMDTVEEVDSKKEITITSETIIKPHLTKWRNAEQKCMEIEKILGNTPTDVSVRNEGYDVLSITSDNKKRYIEVKSVKKDWSFSITNNEYTAASQYGDDYYICLICENTDNIDVKYIKNPFKNATFEKRIKQWEWACFEFNSTDMKFDIK